MNKHLLTVDEVAESLHLGRTKIYELIRLGRIETVLIGTSRRVPANALDDFVASIRRECRADANSVA